MPNQKGNTYKFCYGPTTVHSIDNWTEPPGDMTQVTYTYQLSNMPAWAKRPEVQALDNRLALAKAPSQPQTVILQLTHTGWEVRIPGQ